MSRTKKDTGQQKIGLERIERLFELSEKDFKDHPERSHRNVQLARKIAMRYNIRIPSRLKNRFCRKCYKYLSTNINCTTSKRQGVTTIKCIGCGTVMKSSSTIKAKGLK